jgi:predicted MFS family arabinose efflux permease
VPQLRPAQITLALALYGLGGVAGTFLGEVATSRDVRWAFAAAAATVALAAFMAGVAGPSVIAAFGLVTVWGVAFGAVPVCVQIWMYKADPVRFEGGSALMVASFQIALSAGAFGGGLVVDTAGLRATMLLGAALSLGGALLIGSLGGTSRPVVA